MEAGYDYLYFLRQSHRRVLRFWGVFLISLGVLLLAGGSAYYGYAARVRADLAQLNASRLASTLHPAWQTEPEEQVTGRGGVLAAEIETTPAGFPANAAPGQGSYSSEGLPPAAWSNPQAYESAEYLQQAMVKAFTPLAGRPAAAVGTLAAATQLSIPALDVNSPVQELRILDLVDSRAYETPRHTVGHIPQSADSGEAGSAWFFGHLESPLAGEGSVFYSLPRIPEMLRQGKEVYIVTGNGPQQFLYRVTSTQVVPQDQLKLYDTGKATIHLVTCVPSLVYDHRLVVHGELVGVRQ
ncbi:MAG: sortase [Dehalococcoidia bacterium]|nr:sortase [Dehalococcoidia bacterium]MSQ16552.1 sortase [Dehalococcoidia bacterium]